MRIIINQSKSAILLAKIKDYALYLLPSYAVSRTNVFSEANGNNLVVNQTVVTKSQRIGQLIAITDDIAVVKFSEHLIVEILKDKVFAMDECTPMQIVYTITGDSDKTEHTDVIFVPKDTELVTSRKTIGTIIFHKIGKPNSIKSIKTL